MEIKDEKWLLSSISRAWDDVRIDASKGYIWTEMDTVASFYRHLIPIVERRNSDPMNGLGEMRVLTEVRIIRQVDNKARLVDLAIVNITDQRVPKPSGIIVHFEFKFGWTYKDSTEFRAGRMKDFKRIESGNEGWFIKANESKPANTDFVVIGLVANTWDIYTPKGILHPNGEGGYPLLENLRTGIRYFELHGPFVNIEREDYILASESRWGFFEISREGEKRKI
ncbi:MAG: hypothetical protein ACTSWA_08500 [Candidatus Thorarchaeota archaeon]